MKKNLKLFLNSCFAKVSFSSMYIVHQNVCKVIATVKNPLCPLGHDGFAEGLEDYGEYLLFQYLFWLMEVKPNAKGEFKSLKETRDFDEFFNLDVDTVETYYEPTDPNNGVVFETLLEAIEFEINVVNKMKHLNLEEPFNTWADETMTIFLDAKQFYHEEQYNESYSKYSEGLKRIHDLYFTIPEYNPLE